MNTQLLLWLSMALLSVLGSLWLMNLMPSGSGFGAALDPGTLNGWHGLVALTSLTAPVLTLLAVRLSARS